MADEKSFGDELLEKLDRLTTERARIPLRTPGQRTIFQQAYVQKSVEIDAVLEEYNSWRALKEDLDQL